MDVSFSDKKLEKILSDYKKCIQKYGQVRADNIFQRMGDFNDARSVADVMNMPGHYHLLTGDRKGQFACDVDSHYRLIFAPVVHPIPCDDSGRYLLDKIRSIRIIEVIDYHGK